jgi:hypothetical protein
MFSARLRLPGSMKLEEKKNRVEHLIEMLGLKECADTYVGDEKVNPTCSHSLVSLKFHSELRLVWLVFWC